MLDIYTNSLSALRLGRFPLHHDFVMEVQFKSGCPLRRMYFTGNSDHLHLLAECLGYIPLVSICKSYPIDYAPFL